MNAYYNKEKILHFFLKTQSTYCTQLRYQHEILNDEQNRHSIIYRTYVINQIWILVLEPNKQEQLGYSYILY